MDVLLFLGLLVVLYAAFVDVRTTEVPDWLTYGGIIFGISMRGFFSFMESDWSILTTGLLGLSIMWVVGISLYYTAQWGGGDAKLLWALGAILGVGSAFDQELIAFLMNLLVAGGIYGMLYTMVMGFLYRKKTAKRLSQLARSPGVAKLRLWSYLGCLFLLVLAFGFSSFARVVTIPVALMLPLSFYMWLLTRSVEDVAMVKKTNPQDLMEGDWVLDTIKDEDKTICSSRDPGLTVRQIDQLRKLHKQDKLKHVTVKHGIPFTPAFLIAYVLMLSLGNIFLHLRYAF